MNITVLILKDRSGCPVAEEVGPKDKINETLIKLLISGEWPLKSGDKIEIH